MIQPSFQLSYTEGRPSRIAFTPLPVCSCTSHFPILRDVVMKYLNIEGWHMNGDNNLEYVISIERQFTFDEDGARLLVAVAQAQVSEAMDALMKYGDMHMAWEAYLKAKGAG